jgi:DNA-binding transcriptional LysR family regulator
LHLSRSLNFRTTALHLNQTPPAVTRQIQLLEKEIGAMLFYRTTKQVKLTPAGLFFQQEISKTLSNLTFVVERTNQIHHGEAGNMRLAFSNSATQYLMPSILKNLKAKLPNLHTNIHMDITNKDIVDALRSKDIEIAFTPNLSDQAEICSKIIYSENLVFIYPKDKIFHLTQKEDFVNLAKENFILPPFETSFGYLEGVYNMCKVYGNFTPQSPHKSNHATTILRLVEVGLGVSIMPKSCLLGQNININFIELDFIPQKANMMMLWMEDRTEEFTKFFECVYE